MDKRSPKIVICFLMLLCVQSLTAEVKECSKSGRWDDTSIWIGSYVPAANDDVFINSGVVVELHSDIQCHSLIINEAIINIIGGHLKVTGDIYLNGIIQGTGKMTLSGDGSFIDGKGKVIGLDEVIIFGNKSINSTADIYFGTSIQVVGGFIINKGNIECEKLNIFNAPSVVTKLTLENGSIVVNLELCLYAIADDGQEVLIELLQSSEMIINGDVKIIGDVSPASINIRDDSDLKIEGDVRLVRINGQIAELTGDDNATISIDGNYILSSHY